VLQVNAQVIGNDAAIVAAAAQGQLELLTAIPVIARNLLESIRLLAAAARVFDAKCLAGIEARAERAAGLVEDSLAMVTALAPALGYDRAAALAHEAWTSGRRVRELALERKLLAPDELARLLDPLRQTGR
jgi:fumarate hydratase class II